MIRRITEIASIALILTGLFLVDPALVVALVGFAGLFIADRLERTPK